MKISEHYNSLLKSKEYKEFIKKNKKAYFCSCFFMIDREHDTKEINFDYFVPFDEKIKKLKKPSVQSLEKDNNKIPTSNPPPSYTASPTLGNENNEETKKQKGQIYVFKITDKLSLVSLEFFDKRIPEKLVLDKNLDLEEFEKLIEERMQKENIKEKAKKFLYSFHIAERKKLLFVTIFLSNLALLKVNFDLETKKMIDFDRKSFFDIIKFVK